MSSRTRLQFLCLFTEQPAVSQARTSLPKLNGLKLFNDGNSQPGNVAKYVPGGSDTTETAGRGAQLPAPTRNYMRKVLFWLSAADKLSCSYKNIQC